MCQKRTSKTAQNARKPADCWLHTILTGPHSALGYRPPAPETIRQMDQQLVMHSKLEWTTQVALHNAQIAKRIYIGCRN